MIYKDVLKSCCPHIDNFYDALTFPHQLYLFFLALLVVSIDFIVFRVLLGGFNE